jgi:hemerythrin-like domain-containing protein
MLWGSAGSGVDELEGERMFSTVSPEIRHSLHEEHKALRVLQEELLESFEDFLVEPNERGQESLHNLFREFASTLERHFDFEEMDGYLSSVLERRPNRAPAVAKLREEHAVARAMLTNMNLILLNDLEGSVQLRRDFKDRCFELLDLLCRHEREERELVMETFWLEGGVAG